jgi:hypothetical protein
MAISNSRVIVGTNVMLRQFLNRPNLEFSRELTSFLRIRPGTQRCCYMPKHQPIITADYDSIDRLCTPSNTRKKYSCIRSNLGSVACNVLSIFRLDRTPALHAEVVRELTVQVSLNHTQLPKTLTICTPSK